MPKMKTHRGAAKRFKKSWICFSNSRKNNEKIITIPIIYNKTGGLENGKS